MPALEQLQLIKNSQKSIVTSGNSFQGSRYHNCNGIFQSFSQNYVFVSKTMLPTMIYLLKVVLHLLSRYNGIVSCRYLVGMFVLQQ